MAKMYEKGGLLATEDGSISVLAGGTLGAHDLSDNVICMVLPVAACLTTCLPAGCTRSASILLLLLLLQAAARGSTGAPASRRRHTCGASGLKSWD